MTCRTPTAGADRIFNLARLGFFTGARFYRVVPNWVVQFGVSGSPAISAVYDFRADVPGAILPTDPVVASNLRGHIAFSAAYGTRFGHRTAVNRTAELFIRSPPPLLPTTHTNTMTSDGGTQTVVTTLIALLESCPLTYPSGRRPGPCAPAP